MWGECIPRIFLGIILAYILIGIAKLIYFRKVKKEKVGKINFYHILIFLVISLYPFLWYAVVKNHSFIHTYFTYRNISVFMINIQIALAMYLNLMESKSEEKYNDR